MGELDFSSEVVTLKTIHPNSWDSNADESLKKIRKQLSQLMKDEIPNDKPRYIFIVGRKANLLFNSLDRNISEIHQIVIIRLYQKVIRTQIKRKNLANPPMDSAIILTDSIRNGNETSKVINYLKKRRKIKVEKICGYFGKNYGIYKIKKKYPHIELKFIRRTNTLKQYYEIFNKLHPIYQSSVEPLEADIPYRIYRVKSKLKECDMHGTLNSVAGQFEETTEAVSSCHELCINDVDSFSVDVGNADVLIPFLPFSEEIESIELLNFRFRHFKKSSLIRIKVVCHFHFQNFVKNGKSLTCRNKKNKFCEVFKSSSRTKNYMCLQCKDHQISMYLINKIGKLWKKNAILHGCDLSKPKTYSVIRIFKSDDLRKY